MTHEALYADSCFITAAAVADAKRGPPWGAALQRLLGLDQLPGKQPMVPSGAEARFRGTVGTAFDYRVRFYMPTTPGRKLVADWGALETSFSSASVPDRFRWFIENLDELLGRVSVAGAPLTETDERLLCQYCATLAEFEAAFRSPLYSPSIPRSNRKEKSPIEKEPLLAMASPQVVDDVVSLSRSVPETLGQLIDAVTNRNVLYVPNPTFAGSLDVGGADADFVIGDTLFEVKTVSILDPAAVREALVQLVGYTLIDYSDQFGIRNVAVYFARHQWVESWPLWRVIFPVADVVRHLDETEPTEKEISARLRAGRDGMRSACAEGT